MKGSIRTGLLAVVPAALLALPASSASGAVTIGSDLTNPPTDGAAGTDSTFTQLVPDTGSFVSPITGVVVRWRVMNPAGASQKPRVLRTTDGGTTFTGVATGPVATSPDFGAIPFPINPGLPIRAGDYFGADQLTVFGLNFSSAVPPATMDARWVPALADGGAPLAPTGSTNLELLVNADVEPDGDVDRYGDETQDACPNQGSLHVTPCNTFTLGAVTALKKGVVTVTAALPGAGTLSAGAATDKSLPARVAKKKKKKKRKGPLMKRADLTRTDTSAGNATLTLTPSARGRKKLKKKGLLGVAIKVVYTPAGGAPAASHTAQVVLQP